MNILILGNGFDLAHQLKTTYTDFLDCCKKYPSNGLISEDDNINSEFKDIIGTNLWLNFLKKLI
jgi:hypothetical protein